MLECCRVLSHWWFATPLDAHYTTLPMRPKSTIVAPMEGWDRKGDLDVNPRHSGDWPFAVECFGRGTLVMTREGFRPIESLSVGDRVLTHRGRFRKVTDVFSKKTSTSGELLCEAMTEPIVVTASHPVEDFDGGWRPAREARSLSHMSLLSNRADSQAKWLRVPTYPAKSRGPKARPVAVSRVRVDEDLMRLLGLYAAEGRAEVGSVTWTFHEAETEYIEFVRRMLEQVFGEASVVYAYEETKAVTVSVSSTALAHCFKSWMGSGSAQKRLGLHVWRSKSLVAALLRGYFEGNGCRGPGFARSETVSRRLALEVQFALLRLGVFSRVGVSLIASGERKRPRPLYSVQVARSSLDRFRSAVWGNGGFADHRAASCLSDERTEPVYDLRRSRIFTRLRSPWSLTEGRREVWNLSVEEDETYVIEGGIVVHNCKKIEGDKGCREMERMFEQPKYPLWAWWDQCVAQAETWENAHPLLIFSRNRRKTYVLIRAKTLEWLQPKPQKGPILTMTRPSGEVLGMLLLDDLVQTMLRKSPRRPSRGQSRRSSD